MGTMESLLEEFKEALRMKTGFWMKCMGGLSMLKLSWETEDEELLAAVMQAVQ